MKLTRILSGFRYFDVYLYCKASEERIIYKIVKQKKVLRNISAATLSEPMIANYRTAHNRIDFNGKKLNFFLQHVIDQRRARQAAPSRDGISIYTRTNCSYTRHPHLQDNYTGHGKTHCRNIFFCRFLPRLSGRRHS